MPEEINRVVTDGISQVLLTPSVDADENLIREGVPQSAIYRVGNAMIDSLIQCLPMADGTGVLAEAGIQPGTAFVLATLHRPSSVDDPSLLRDLVDALSTLAADIPVVLPVHPRTRARIQSEWVKSNGLRLTAPLPYLPFIDLERKARLVITDSGGVQEETTYLGVPCLTVRENTERPVTVTIGTNTLVGRNPQRMLLAARAALRLPVPTAVIPELWDGCAGQRIAAALSDVLQHVA